MEYIYTRISTEEQENTNQIHHLILLHPEAQVIEEIGSGAKDKPALRALLARLRRGDTLIVAALDRIGRTAWQSIKTMDDLYEKGVAVKSLREGIDYATAAGRTTARLMLVVAETERDLIVERTKAALARLKAQGVRLGRPPNHSPEAEQAALKYRQQGMTFEQIRDLTNISMGKLSKLFRT